MSSRERKVIHLLEHDAEGALARLNRITGLTFARWPESLVPRAEGAAEQSVDQQHPDALGSDAETA